MIVNAFPPISAISKLRNMPKVSDSHLIEWPNVIVKASERNYSKHAPESSFSILTNHVGTASIRFQKRELKVCEQSFLLLTPYRSFDYEIRSTTMVSTHNIHFNYRFCLEAYDCLTRSDSQLLNDPTWQGHDQITFSDQLHFRNGTFNRLINSHSLEDPEMFFIDLLAHLLTLEKEVRLVSLSIPSKKETTRQEIMRRMIQAKDMLFSSYDDPDLTIEAIAKEIAMSKFHFLRSFRSVYGQTPHQFLKGIRYTKAMALLKNAKHPIKEIAQAIGFKEANSIFPFLKKADKMNKQQ